jgi:hypothetical protein
MFRLGGGRVEQQHTGLRPPFLFCWAAAAFSGGAPVSASGVGELSSIESSEPSRVGSFLSIDMLSAIAFVVRNFLFLALPHCDNRNTAGVVPELKLHCHNQGPAEASGVRGLGVASWTYVAITSDYQIRSSLSNSSNGTRGFGNWN